VAGRLRRRVRLHGRSIVHLATARQVRRPTLSLTCAAVKVFISYRREDSAGYTGRLYDSLRAPFGADNVFVDVSGIDWGRNFADVIRQAIQSCDVLLAIIGPDWLTCVANGRRRLDDPADLVRSEIATALKSGIPVIPVLVGGAAPPTRAMLPPPLQPLAAVDAHQMSDERWAFDNARLVHAIEKLARGAKPATTTRRTYAAAAVLVVLTLVGGVFFRTRSSNLAPAGGATAVAATTAGTWQADVAYGWGAKYTERLSLSVDGDLVSGTATFLGVPRAITAGSIAGNRILFETHTQEVAGDFSQPRDVIHRYHGRVDGDSIAFTLTTEGGTSPSSAQFVATRAPARP
jgi:hypothetical protein